MEFIATVIKGLVIIAATIALVAGLGLFLAWPIKWTWNATMPAIFSLPAITWGQAWCLMFLAGCLLKSTHSSKEN